MVALGVLEGADVWDGGDGGAVVAHGVVMYRLSAG